MTQKSLDVEWKERIEEQKQSGKSQSAWCRENNINIKTFGYWNRKLKNQKSNDKRSEISWVPVNIETPKISKLNIRIGTAVIEIEKGFDESLLSDVVKVLGEIC